MKFDRRTFVKSLMAVPCAVAGYFVYEELTTYEGEIRTIGAPDLPQPTPVRFDAVEDHCCFYAVGDTGLASEAREAVIEEMLKQGKKLPPDFIFLAGDNFYESGVESVEDPKWQDHFEIPFSTDRFDVPFYACLGNHDYFGNVAAQVEYSNDHPRWNMPAPYYTFSRQIGRNVTADFFVLDTTPIEEGDHSTEAQLRWFREKLAGSQADWKIVVGHHPLYSGGEHGRSRRNYRALSPLLEEYEVDLYICGHDHDLQLHDTGRGWLHLISGSGSKLRSVRWVDTTLFARAESGFARVNLTPQRLSVEVFGINGLLFTHEKQKTNQLSPRWHISRALNGID